MSAPAGLVASFGDPDELCRAIRRLRETGYSRLEAYTPFPIAEVSDALGERGRRIPWIAGLSALAGSLIMIAVQWWAGAAYPLNIGGRPTLPWPAFVSSTAIVALLWMALGTFVGLLWLTGLPRLRHPVFAASAFDRLWEGSFLLMVEVADPRFDPAATRALLEALGSRAVEAVSA